MDEFLKEVEKVIKAGIGAVAAGMEKAQGAVDKLAKKGEPIYQQAKTSVAEFADKVCKTFQELGKPKLADMIHDAQSLTDEDLTALHKGIGEMITMRAEEAAAAAQAAAAAEEIISTEDVPAEENTPAAESAVQEEE